MSGESFWSTHALDGGRELLGNSCSNTELKMSLASSAVFLGSGCATGLLVLVLQLMSKEFKTKFVRGQKFYSHFLSLRSPGSNFLRNFCGCWLPRKYAWPLTGFGWGRVSTFGSRIWRMSICSCRLARLVHLRNFRGHFHRLEGWVGAENLAMCPDGSENYSKTLLWENISDLMK